MSKHGRHPSGRPIRSQKYYLVHFDDLQGGLIQGIIPFRSFTDAYMWMREAFKVCGASEIWRYSDKWYRDGSSSHSNEQMLWYDGKKLRRFARRLS